MQGVYQIKIFLSIAQISPLTKGILLSAYEFLIIFSDCQTPEIYTFIVISILRTLIHCTFLNSSSNT
jgi:hypothetical protein